MTGIMVAVAGSIKRINYANGLYGPSGVDLSPITDSASNVGTISRTWIGYYQPSITKSYTFGIQTLWNSSTSSGQYSIGYVWVGNNAISNYSSGNALATSDNNSGSGSISLLAGLYYPIRIEWDAYLPSGFFGSTGSMAFSVDSSTNVSSHIFYNSATNGF